MPDVLDSRGTGKLVSSFKTSEDIILANGETVGAGELAFVALSLAF